jgi:hypothetical protein
LSLLPALLLLPALAAQTPPSAPAQVTLVPRYNSGSQFYYAVTIHSEVTTTTNQTQRSNATLDTQAEIEMHILSASQPGSFEAAMRFTKYHTSVASADAAVKAQLQAKSAHDDAAALAMTPARFSVAAGKFTLVSRQPGGDYDQAVDMLSELVRTEDLPTGPVGVGAQWTRVRNRDLPGMNANLPITLQCSLTALGSDQGQPTATIEVHSTGAADLPPGSLPGAQEMAREGVVPIGKISSNTVSTSQFRLADAVLLASSSETHSQVSIQLISPSPTPQSTESLIHSTGTVKLERAAPKA